MVILPITYLGNTEWFRRLLQGGAVIDTGENWVKQTARNRCEIMTSNGVAVLTVPIHSGGRVKIATKDIRIDNSRRWQHTHWTTLVSAYRNSPYFDHYEEKFAPIYSKKINYLAEINLELLDVVISALRLDSKLQVSENYVAASPDDVDLRGKKALRRLNDLPPFIEYTQVFSDKIPFAPGLSIVDLLFCEGPAARDYLR